MLHAAVARRAYQLFERRGRRHQLHQHQLAFGRLARFRKPRRSLEEKTCKALEAPHYGLPGRSVIGFPLLSGN